jgi:hypothetical protein
VPFRRGARHHPESAGARSPGINTPRYRCEYRAGNGAQARFATRCGRPPGPGGHAAVRTRRLPTQEASSASGGAAGMLKRGTDDPPRHGTLSPASCRPPGRKSPPPQRRLQGRPKRRVAPAASGRDQGTRTPQLPSAMRRNSCRLV